MIIKAISNKEHRDITIDKIYPVIIKENDSVRIIDDFGGLSVYNLYDFKIYKENSSLYNKNNSTFTYYLVNYPTFLEKYYNDDKESIKKLMDSRKNILKEDLNGKELLELIVSNNYTDDEKIIFIEAIKNKLDNNLSELLAEYFLKKIYINSELLLYICEILSIYHNEKVYELFLKYISDETIENDSVQDIIIEYFNEYN